MPQELRKYAKVSEGGTGAIRLVNTEISTKPYIVMGDGVIDPTGDILPDKMTTKYAYGRVATKYLTQLGDIIVCKKYPFTAALINDENTGRVVAKDYIVVRLKAGAKVNSRYINCVINVDSIARVAYKRKLNGEYDILTALELGKLKVIEVPTVLQDEMGEVYVKQCNILKLYREVIRSKKHYFGERITALLHRMNNLEKIGGDKK